MWHFRVLSIGVFVRRQSLLLAVLFVGCNLAEPQQPLKSTGRFVQPVTAAFKATGLDCSIEGSSVCLPGPRGERALCFHYGPGLQADGGDPGYVCTTTCERDADCMEEFLCRPVVAGDTKVCMPNRDFVPKVARARSTVAQRRSPPSSFPPAEPLPHLMDGGAQ